MDAITNLAAWLGVLFLGAAWAYHRAGVETASAPLLEARNWWAALTALFLAVVIGDALGAAIGGGE